MEKVGRLKRSNHEKDAGGKDGWLRMKYKPEFERFEVLSQEEIELRSPTKSYQWDKRTEEFWKNNGIVHVNEPKS